MEILIPGLILVALMVWASTKIKKRAADAFEAEPIEADDYRLQKPEGFLHVIGDRDHEFYAYSKDFGVADSSGIRRATIEMDVIAGADFAAECEKVKNSDASEITTGNVGETKFCRIETDESANEIASRSFYKIVGGREAVYKLRFNVLAEHVDQYLRNIDETLESFEIKTN